MLFKENLEVLQHMNFTEQCCAIASDFCDIFIVLLALLVINQFSHGMEI